MSVLECRRNGCERIMCNRYSHTYGYICWECFNELKSSGMSIQNFMNTPKGVEHTYNYDEEFKLDKDDENEK